MPGLVRCQWMMDQSLRKNSEPLGANEQRATAAKMEAATMKTQYRNSDLSLIKSPRVSADALRKARPPGSHLGIKVLKYIFFE